VLAHQRDRPDQRDQRLRELDLAGLGHADRGHAAVPDDESAALRDRRTATLSALTSLLPDLTPLHPPLGGYHLWLRLPEGTAEPAIVAAALRQGVAVTAGTPYFSAETSTPHLRLSYVSPANTSHLEEAIHRLHHA
jgi:DNA-binding transcriptional MocR family regulator